MVVARRAGPSGGRSDRAHANAGGHQDRRLDHRPGAGGRRQRRRDRRRRDAGAGGEGAAQLHGPLPGAPPRRKGSPDRVGTQGQSTALVLDAPARGGGVALRRPAHPEQRPSRSRARVDSGSSASESQTQRSPKAAARAARSSRRARRSGEGTAELYGALSHAVAE